MKWSEVAQSCPTLCYSVDCSLPGSSLHGILQARVLEWVAISFSRGSSQPRDWTRVSCIAGRCFNLWATRTAKKVSPTAFLVFSPAMQHLSKEMLQSFLSCVLTFTFTYSFPWGLIIFSFSICRQLKLCAILKTKFNVVSIQESLFLLPSLCLCSYVCLCVSHSVMYPS